MIIGTPPVVGIEDVVQGYFAHEMFHLNQLELEQQATLQRTVSLAVRARTRTAKAAKTAREASRVRATEAVDGSGERARARRSGVRVAR